MRLTKRGYKATENKTARSSRLSKFNYEKGLVQETRLIAGSSAHHEEPADKAGCNSEPKIIRRQDYAGIYQVGRRASPSQNLRPGTMPGAGAFGAGVAAAPALRVRARRLKVQPKLFIIIACAALLTALAVFGTASISQRPTMVKGQELYFDGRMLCIAGNQDTVKKALQKIQDDLKSTYGMDIQCSEKLSFTPVVCDSQNICSEQQIEKAIKDNIDVKVMASVITVNDRPAVALHSAEEAQQALDTALAPFRNAAPELYRTDVSFVENVKIQEMPIEYGLVQPKDEAVHTLTLGANVADNIYTVKKGDSLAKIAKKFNLKVSDLRKANPVIASSDVIQPGDALNAVKPNNWVNIRFTETITRQETLPFDTVEQPSATMYTTQKEISQQGRNGVREVVAKVIFINGMEAQKDILTQTIVQPAQNQIIMRGTKKVPTNAGYSSSGSSSSLSGSFIPPLKQYRISSIFEVRTMSGVTRWHYGDDMAAPMGTPIYASRTGTISYAGSASGYGLLIMIDHGGGIQTRYGHCSKLLVKKGQKVTQGQIIGLVGSTGHSTGPHCHFEIRINGTPVNPMKYVRL